MPGHGNTAEMLRSTRRRCELCRTRQITAPTHGPLCYSSATLASGSIRLLFMVRVEIALKFSQRVAEAEGITERTAEQILSTWKLSGGKAVLLSD